MAYHDDTVPPPTPAALGRRTIEFVVAVTGICKRIRGTPEGRTIADQLFRSASSVAANYRAACRARSPREFVAKLGIVVEECDEALFWLELIARLKLIDLDSLRPHTLEADQLTAIFVVTRGTARRRLLARTPRSSIRKSQNQSR